MKIAKGIRAAILGALLAALNTPAQAQSYPSRPVKIIVPFSAGVLDTIARSAGQRLAQKWGQPVVIENKPGAGGNIGADAVARAPGDGAAFLLGGPSLVINLSLYDRVPYTLMKDLIPVSDIARAPFVIVTSPTVPARTLAELIAYARANPGKLNFGSGGVGTGSHLAGELFKLTTRTDIVHIPHKGAAATLAELLAGRIQLAVDTTTQYAQYIDRGDLRGIAVPAARRLLTLPNVPTTKEAGVDDLEAGAWASLWAPGDTSQAIIDKVSKDIADVVASAELRSEWGKLGIEPVGGNPQQLQAFAQAELKKWSEVVRASGAKAN